jgi:hypothetical protein
MARIKVTDTSQGRSFRTGVNGRFYDLPVGVEQNVDDALLDHLEGLGVAFETIEGPSKRASSSKEGSEDGLAPIGPHDVLAPAMVPRVLGERESFKNGSIPGDQPGDLTAGGVKFSGGAGTSIVEDAEVSDIRVAAERSAPEDASVARIAGEGEGGTKSVDAPQPVAPSHKETAAEKKSKAAAAKKAK